MKNISANALRWITAILVTVLMIAAVGCGNEAGSITTPTPTSTPTTTSSAEPTGETGTLSGMEGDVQVLRVGASTWEVATSGMKVGEGYGLKTGSDGYVLITFFDGSVTEMEADTEISIEELSQAAGGSTKVRINQAIGSTINRVENLIDSSSTYEVMTPAGSAVVRGTVYKVRVNQDNGLTRTCIDNIDQEDTEVHYVDFSNSGKTVEVPEEKSACCWEGGQPGEPFYTDPQDDPFQFDGGGGGGGSYGYGYY